MDANLRAIFLISMMLATGILFSPALSSILNYVAIPSSGTIATISPLHVDGRYIKDASNNIVILRGVNVGGFSDNPGGTWGGTGLLTYANWLSNQAKVTAELDAIQSWGCNVVRCHYVTQYWVQNTNSFRTIMYEFAQLCSQRGIYVILDGYGTYGWFDGAGVHQAVGQDPLPYPPYQTYANCSAIIADETAYKNMMVSMATTLQNCSNVILDFWNEAYNPNATLYPTAQSDYFALVNETINTIRGNGINTLLMVQWFYGIGCNIYFPPPAPPTSPPPDFYANVLNWVYDYPLTGSNIVYETHIYNAFGQNVTYSEEQQGLTYCWIPYVTNNMSKPLLIGEIGANVWWTGDNLVAELRTFNYTLQILNSWGIGYTAFFFGINQMYSLITSYNPSWTPSGAGTVLMKNIAVTPPKLP